MGRFDTCYWGLAADPLTTGDTMIRKIRLFLIGLLVGKMALHINCELVKSESGSVGVGPKDGCFPLAVFVLNKV